MAWTSKQQLFSSATVEDTELFGTSMLLDPGQKANIAVKGTFGGTTDDIVASVYGNVDTETIAASAAVAAGGTGYSEDDVLTLVGGTFGTVATFVVTGETAGVVDTVALVNAGDYSATPADAVVTTGGGGSGCTLNVTWTGNDWDTEAIATATLSQIVGSKVKTFLVTDYYRIRVGVVSSGSTDTHTVVITSRTYSPSL